MSDGMKLHPSPAVDWEQCGDFEDLYLVIEAELLRAERHGRQFASLHEAYAVILEELDEVWIICKQKRKDRNAEELRKELIQVAAMAVKALKSMENFTGGAV